MNTSAEGTSSGKPSRGKSSSEPPPHPSWSELLTSNGVSFEGPDDAPSEAPRGPVADLGAHVPDEWWKTLFGPTYLLTDADVLDEENTRAEVDALIEALDLTPEARILDLCCGQGRHALELARRGYAQVCGLDQSTHLIGEAQAAAQAAPFDVNFRVGDARSLPYDDGAFDAVLLMGNSFGYFAAEEDDRLALREVRRVLRKGDPEQRDPAGGRLLLDLTDGAWLRARYEPRSWEWIDAEHLACRERTLDGQRLVTREVVVQAENGIIADQFYAERLYDRREMTALLQESGFANVEVSDTPATTSDRGQDLGMMARRLFFTARAACPGTERRTAEGGLAGSSRRNGSPAKKTRHVAVLLGDPRLADETKLGGVFDEDDFEVVRRLEDALATLDGYAFSYHNHHAAFESELRALRGEADFALNLCDEGLGNDPRRELHVPALLDMIGLPYTGSEPQCLGACYDKSLVRGVAREMGIAVAEARYLAPGAPAPDQLNVDFPVIVKPNTGDNSKGITQRSVARTPAELAGAVTAVREQVGSGRALLIEAFLPGQDLTVGLLGNAGPGFSEDDLTVLPITAEDYAHLPDDLPRLCGYEAKWLPDSPYWHWPEEEAVQADLPAETRALLEQGSRRLFARLGCRDYARLDWRLDADGLPRLLEVNPNPGWCFDGHLVTQAALTGTDYPGLLRSLLEAAQYRFATADRREAGKGNP